MDFKNIWKYIVGIIFVLLFTLAPQPQPAIAQFEIELGLIYGTVSWDTERRLAMYAVKVDGNTAGFSQVYFTRFEDGFYSTGWALPPDTYSVTVYKTQQGAPQQLGQVFSNQTVTVGQNETVLADFDLTNTIGFVKGNLRVNGVLSDGYVQFCGPLETDPCPISGNPFNYTNGPWNSFGSADGFNIPLLPEDYRVHIITQNRVDVGIIPISLNAGERIDLTTSSVSVPVGQNVTVTLGNITVTFTEVTASGIMSVTTTSHPQGGQPPSQYRFLRDYYEMTTTAEYTGLVAVSFTYDEADVQGQESNLKLFHWDGSGWQDITVSVNTVNNIITGETPTLSLFAIGDLLNSPPTVDAGGPYSVDEGNQVTVSATGSDPENGPLTYAWDLDNNGSFETPGQSVNFSAATLDGPSSPIIAVQVTDDGGLTATDQAIVGVLNVAPAVSAITAPVDPSQTSTQINTSVTFTDAGIPDAHTAEWNWGDTLTSPGTVDQLSGTVTGSHFYTSAGVYEVKVTVSDDDNDSTLQTFQFVVIFDADGSFVTGGGWVDSPIGAYPTNSTLTGKANFGFVSKYQRGANVPTGETQFRFKVADLNFHSSDYDWLVVAGPQAKFKGTGTVNGDENYGFQLSGTDGAVNGGGGVDKFRIKIWDIDSNDEVVYDNELGAGNDEDPTTAITGGNVVIH